MLHWNRGCGKFAMLVRFLHLEKRSRGKQLQKTIFGKLHGKTPFMLLANMPVKGKFGAAMKRDWKLWLLIHQLLSAPVIGKAEAPGFFPQSGMVFLPTQMALAVMWM